jgi:hypothetical protein
MLSRVLSFCLVPTAGGLLVVRLQGEREMASPGLNSRLLEPSASSSDVGSNAAGACIPLSPDARLWLGRNIVNSLYVKAFIMLCVLIDAVILTVELINDSVDDRAWFCAELSSTLLLNFAVCPGVEYSLTILIICLFLLDVLLNLIYMDVLPFFSDIWCILDLFLTLSFGKRPSFRYRPVSNTSVVLAVFAWALAPQIGRFFTLMRLLRLLRVCFVFYRQQGHIKASVRKFVSQNRRRYVAEGFDLDVTPITDRILVWSRCGLSPAGLIFVRLVPLQAMSVPAVRLESLYRNPVEEVARFFNTKFRHHYRW